MTHPSSIQENIDTLRSLRSLFSKQHVPVTGSINLTQRCNLNCVHCRAGSERGPYPGEFGTAKCLEILGQISKVEALRSAGIPFMGHLGMLPQRVVQEGGYKKKGKSTKEADLLVEAACALESAGAFSMVLESVIPEVAERITGNLKIQSPHHFYIFQIFPGYLCDGNIINIDFIPANKIQ